MAKKYKSAADAIDELQGDIGALKETVEKESTSTSGNLSVLARIGVDGRLTGADVLISAMALGLGLVTSFLVFLAKLADNYRVRNALGSAVDVMLFFIALVALRFLLDILSVPAVLSAFFEVKSILTEDKPREIVREPFALHTTQKSQERVYIGLPNGEMLEDQTLSEFVTVVKGQKGTAWSREEWCNEPDNLKRPGRGLMTQDQWSGLKTLLENANLWRTNDISALEGLENNITGE